MSSPQGTYGEFVDTQDVEIENITTGNIYTQARTILPKFDHFMTEHHTCNGFVEKLASLDNASLPVTIVLTEPELVDIFGAVLDDDGRIPAQEWRIKYTSFTNNFTTVTGWAKMFEFQILDRGEDVVHIAFRLEYQSDMVGGTAKVITIA